MHILAPRSHLADGLCIPHLRRIPEHLGRDPVFRMGVLDGWEIIGNSLMMVTGGEYMVNIW